MQPILESKNKELEEALVIVNKDKAIADEKEQVVSAEAVVVNKKASEAKAIADDAEADLALAKPELEAAERAVQSLDKNSINEIKAFTTPPEGVVFVMKAIMILLGGKTDWKEIKKYISDVNGFLKELMTFNVEKVKDKTWEKVRKDYINSPNFEPSRVKSVNIAAASLCVWAIACSRYAEVTKKVGPKKARLAEVTSVLKEA
jgi:dynein heavy chain